MKRTFVCIDPVENHKKFWTIEITGRCHVRCTWGRIGTDGRDETFYFDGGGAAKYAAKKINEKLGRGYVEIA